MDIIYLGHSSFKIASKTASVITDPFDPAAVGLTFPKVSATIVTCSHKHDDHSRADLVSDVKKVLDGPGEYEIEGISFIGIPTYHDDKKGEERGGNIIFVIEIDGVRIAHLGDLGHKLSDAQISSMGSIDILMVPVGGYYTIDAKIAAEVVEAIAPTIVIPMHYLVDGLSPEIAPHLSGVDAFVSALGKRVETNTKLTVKPGALEEDERIVVLTRK